MKRISMPIFILSTMVLVSSCSDIDSNNNQRSGDSGEYVLHDALKANSEVTFKLKSGKNVKWKLGTDEKSGEEVKFTVKAGKNTITAIFDNGTTITSDIFVPANVKYSIDLSENHALIANGDKGSMYAYGKNDKGQLCIPTSTASEIKDPEVVLSEKNVTSIATGENHTLYADGVKVFGCGDNSKGQLGDGTANEKGIVAIENIPAMDLVKKNGADIDTDKTKPVENANVVSVLLRAGGNLSVAAVLDERIQEGQYKWNHASLYRFGSIGTNIQKTPLYVFGYKTNSPENNADVSVGREFAIFKPYEYNLFSFGVNNNWQLGRSDDPDKTSWGAGRYEKMTKQNPDALIKTAGSIITDKNKENLEFGQVYTPYGKLIKNSTPDNTKFYFQSHPVSKTASGNDFSLIISENKNWGSSGPTDTVVYVVGGKSSVLGLTRDDNQDIIPRAFPIITSSSTKIDTKDVLDEERTVYTNAADTQITGLKVKQVAAGDNNGYILAEDGKLYGFGPNDKNQLTSATTPNEKNDKILSIAAPDGVTYSEVWAGGNRVIALGSDNKLYTWGEDIATPTKMFFKAANQVVQ